MAESVGIGLVGLGWMGRVHAAAYRRLVDHFPDCAGTPQLVIAADEDEARARRAVDELGFARWTCDWREVVAHPDVAGISVTAVAPLPITTTRLPT